MDTEDRVFQRERSIGKTEGTLESLATKEFVRKEVNEAIKAIDAKIDKQTEDMGNKIETLSKKTRKSVAGE